MFTSLQTAFAAGDPILHFTFNEASGTSLIREEVSGTQFSVVNLFNAPERIPAVQGSALRLDGYSTWAHSDYALSQVDKQITLEAWYATDAFPPATDANRNAIEGAAIISQMQSGAGFALEVGPYGNVSLDFYADGKKYVVVTARSLEKWVWNHIVATVDLEARQANIYVNGNLWQSMNLAAHSSLSLASAAPLYIGRHTSPATIEGFNITSLNGALDDLKVFNTVLGPAEVIASYTNFAPEPVAATLFEDFEGTNYGAWTTEGTAFGSQPAAGTLAGQQVVSGYRGNQLVNSFLGGDAPVGKLSSSTFTIQKPLIRFLVGGGNHPGRAEVRLLVNGNTVRTATGRDTEMLREETWDVSEFIGQTARLEIVDQVTGGWGHILADHITFTEEQALLPANLYIDPAVRHAGDYLRPQYHPMPNTAWANEAYGLTYYEGKYHLFFQKNPNGLWLHFMHWGHLSSPDLVHWQEEKTVLAPSEGFDNFGIWSGTTTKDPNGKPVIFYTGVDLAKAGIGLALPKDENLIEWEKHPANPVIPAGPAGYLDFRDPFVWKVGSTYYMIVGAGIANGGGGALPTYKSSDLVNWTRITDLYRSSNLEQSGFFWEMPLFYPLNDQGEYILAVTPLYNGKPANVIYWIGKWENETFTPYFTTPKLLDASNNNTLAPAIGTDAEGRITYIGIVPETRNVGDQLKAGWRQTFSIPRVIRLLQDSTIGHYPHPNLCRLRQNEVLLANRSIAKGSKNNLSEFGGNQLNLKFSVKADSAAKFSLQLLKNDAGTQYTAFHFDLEKNLVALDTRYAHAQEALREYTTADYVFEHKEEIQLEVFIDHSVVEIFIDNLLVLSTRSYPAQSSQGVDLLVTAGAVEILEARQWTMQNMRSSTGAEVCEPQDLPTQFRDLPKEVVTGFKRNDEVRNTIKLYPNPTKNRLTLELPAHLGAYEAAFYSSGGVLVKKKSCRLPDRRSALRECPAALTC
ncbi:LamG-like jellyroll fold domain-containing protein [Cesiribacter andamanensis]|uniref:LamG-like jellyroll fold domain-containing protein n=1 Tax=Cesiribacter andamanensis TaxID=649507 RepID=UPI00034B21FD|nr:LamG-like jellyroll fold domain-containing protein [Cesiribacter andamanensis]